MKKSLQIKVPLSEKKIIFNIQVKKKFNDTTVNKEENNLLSFYKNKIDELEFNKEWDYAKKLSNPYELIHIPNNKSRNDSIADYHPLSRSYYKMIEMLTDYNIFKSVENGINSAYIAEGPGGFMEAVLQYRRNQGKMDDKMYGITLQSSTKEIPGWCTSSNIFKNNRNIHFCYGKDGTGNIYNNENIVDFSNTTCKNSCYLVTADGGFDFSVDFNKQEEIAYRLLFCEIVTAISVQKKKGYFICKFFDTYSIYTIKLMWLLSCLYEKVIITKPVTSRPANCERYVVCCNFIGISDKNYKILLNIVSDWEKLNKDEFIDICDNIPQGFIDSVTEYNKYHAENQIVSIIDTLKIIKNKGKIDINILKKQQTSNGIEWCNKYNVTINNNSKYVKNYLRSLNYSKESMLDGI